MIRRLFSFTPLFAIAFAFAAGISFGAPVVSAQGTPQAGGESAPVAHPAHIHSGTCAELGDVVYPLEDVSTGGVGVAPVATPGASPQATPSGTPLAEEALGEGEVVAESTTVVEASLDDILGADHAINVHESSENIGNYIACGDIIGEPADGTLEIELQELNGSGYSGGASLTDNGDGTTTVTVTLVEVDAGATPAATPAG